MRVWSFNHLKLIKQYKIKLITWYSNKLYITNLQPARLWPVLSCFSAPPPYWHLSETDTVVNAYCLLLSMSASSDWSWIIMDRVWLDSVNSSHGLCSHALSFVFAEERLALIFCDFDCCSFNEAVSLFPKCFICNESSLTRFPTNAI